MKYLGWFLFNVVVFVWSIVGITQRGLWEAKSGSWADYFICTLFIIAGLCLFAWLCFGSTWLYRIIKDKRDSIEQRRNEIGYSIGDIKHFLNSLNCRFSVLTKEHNEIKKQIATLKKPKRSK